jgi:adenylate cyclase
MQIELNRKSSSVYFSDIVGYTRLMGKDENAAFQLMTENLELHKELISLYRGKLIKELGDGILAVFDTCEDAVAAALEIQRQCHANGRYRLRTGIQSGEIIYDHGDIFGDAVNIASRIQSVAIPGSILLSDRVHKQIQSNPGFQTIKLGGFDLKNVDQSLELYALANTPLTVPKRSDILGNIKYQERNPWKNRVGAAVILFLLGAALYFAFWDDVTWEKEKSIAVLPFRSLSGKSFEYFPNALTESIIAQLSKIGSIRTVSYSTMKSLQNPEISYDSLLNVILKQTKVSATLRGSVVKLETGVGIELQLVDVEKNKNIWTESYIREGAGIPEFPNDIAKEIAEILNARLTAEEATQIGKGETANPKAYDLLLKAKDLYWDYGDSSLLQAAEYLKNAIQLDQNYALAYTWLAKTYCQLGFIHPDPIWYDLSLQMSEKALALEPKLAEGYSARGATYYDMGQLSKAEISFENALTHNPNSGEATGNLATIYFARGDLTNAIKWQMKSTFYNPKSFLPYQNIGWAYKILGDYSTAHLWFDRSLEQNPAASTYELKAFAFIQEGKIDSALSQAQKTIKKDSLQWKELGYIYFYSNQFDSALVAFRKEMKGFKSGRYPKYSPVPVAYSYILKLRGDSRLADSILNEAILVKKEAVEMGYEDYYLPLDLATAYAIKSQPDESLKYLQLAYERGWRDFFFTEFNPAFSNLKEDPRYVEILSQIKKNIIEINRELRDKSLQREK